jgi:hypothetical protein
MPPLAAISCSPLWQAPPRCPSKALHADAKPAPEATSTRKTKHFARRDDAPGLNVKQSRRVQYNSMRRRGLRPQ